MKVSVDRKLSGKAESGHKWFALALGSALHEGVLSMPSDELKFVNEKVFNALNEGDIVELGV